jgi:hypothetical protein
MPATERFAGTKNFCPGIRMARSYSPIIYALPLLRAGNNRKGNRERQGDYADCDSDAVWMRACRASMATLSVL